MRVGTIEHYLTLFEAVKAQLEQLGFSLQDEYLDAAQGMNDLPFPAFFTDATASGWTLENGSVPLDFVLPQHWEDFKRLYESVIQYWVALNSLRRKPRGRPMQHVLVGARPHVIRQLDTVVLPYPSLLYGEVRHPQVAVHYRACELAYGALLSAPPGEAEVVTAQGTFIVGRRDGVFGVNDGVVVRPNGKPMSAEMPDFDYTLLMRPRPIERKLPTDCMTWGAIAKFLEMRRINDPQLLQMVCLLRHKKGEKLHWGSTLQDFNAVLFGGRGKKGRAGVKLGSKRGPYKLRDGLEAYHMDRYYKICAVLNELNLNAAMTITEFRKRVGTAIPKSDYKQIFAPIYKKSEDRKRYFETVRAYVDDIEEKYGRKAAQV